MPGIPSKQAVGRARGGARTQFLSDGGQLSPAPSGMPGYQSARKSLHGLDIMEGPSDTTSS